jgi:Mn-dependent DtxR family transcriptional regulator
LGNEPEQRLREVGHQFVEGATPIALSTKSIDVHVMLGASRPTVTVVAGTLQKAGLIKYRHGKVTIVDRENLEAASCECYRAATDLLTVTDGSRPKR